MVGLLNWEPQACSGSEGCPYAPPFESRLRTSECDFGQVECNGPAARTAMLR